MATPEQLSEPYSFCNCGKKGCPDAVLRADGGIVLGAPRSELVERADGGFGVPFDAEAATQLRKWLEEKGF